MFGMNLKTLRAKNNLTQENLAEKLLVSRQAVCMWERGMRMPKITVLTRIAGIFKVSLDHMVSQQLSFQQKKRNKKT